MKSENSLRFLFGIARGDAFGGSSLHVMDMASRLRDQGHTVKILIGGHPDMEVPRRFGARGLTYTCIPSLGRKINPIRDLEAILSIRKEIRKFSPDLISFHSSKAGAVGRIAALGCDTPVLYTPHCWSFVDGFKHAAIYRWMERLLAPTATRIITVSEDEKLFALENKVGKRKQFTTIHNGVKDAFRRVTCRKSDGKGTVRILMVGRFEKQKDQALLIRALSNLQHLPWKLTLVGDGPLRDEAEELTRANHLGSRVHFAGYSDRVESYLKTHDLFALITNWEGFPRSILEAMSASLPVIATDVGGSRESIHQNITGQLVPRGSLKDLTTTLEKMISEPEKLAAMGESARGLYHDEFSFHTMYSRYALLYRETITEHRRKVEQRPTILKIIRRLVSPARMAEIDSGSAKQA